MPKIAGEQYSLMQQKLIQTLKDFDYRFKRYEISYSIAIGHSPDNTDLSIFADYIRLTDRFIILDRNTCAVIFDCTNTESGVKAANNLLNHFQSLFISAPLFTSVVTASNYENTVQMIQELFSLLNYTIAHNMNSIVLTHSQQIQHLQSV
ncbi:MAG TPA: hypothetical protein VFX57_00305 [Sulfuricurvum sp.]|nr:hypothetical protein [Sulfuricurvum sp.]